MSEVAQRSWEIHPFDPEADFYKLLELRRVLEELEPIGNDISEEGQRNTMNWHGHDPSQDRWLVTPGDDPDTAIAHAWLFAQSSERVVSAICVHPAWRRIGIGTLLPPQTGLRAGGRQPFLQVCARCCGCRSSLARWFPCPDICRSAGPGPAG